MKHVYLVQHSYTFANCEETKLIGVYTSMENARNAIQHLKSKPGFNQRPEDFYIDKCELDKDNWTEGFVTVYN